MSLEFPPLILSEEQEEAFIERIAERVVQKCQNFGQRTKPYTVREFHEVTGIPKSSIYVKMETGQIRTVKDFGSKLIPASEIERFL